MKLYVRKLLNLQENITIFKLSLSSEVMDKLQALMQSKET